ncbi:hypothetical protein [Mycolicibacterium sp.]|uniref:hypothetical protein n=1 Tax=Mycolicibacterium sp. TaxID=2320850 RepID=UPI003D0D9654
MPPTESWRSCPPTPSATPARTNRLHHPTEILHPETEILHPETEAGSGRQTKAHPEPEANEHPGPDPGPTASSEHDSPG